jgi:hypothetical protein
MTAPMEGAHVPDPTDWPAHPSTADTPAGQWLRDTTDPWTDPVPPVPSHLQDGAE